MLVRKKSALGWKQTIELVPGKIIDVILNPSDPNSVEILWDSAAR